MDASNLQETLSEIEKFISKKQEVIERGDALKRMKATSDYKLVFGEGYINEEAKRLFRILTDPTGASEYSDEMIQRKLASISDFKGYVGTPDFPGTIEQEAARAPGEIEVEQDTRNQLTADNAEAKDI